MPPFRHLFIQQTPKRQQPRTSDSSCGKLYTGEQAGKTLCFNSALEKCFLSVLPGWLFSTLHFPVHLLSSYKKLLKNPRKGTLLVCSKPSSGFSDFHTRPHLSQTHTQTRSAPPRFLDFVHTVLLAKKVLPMISVTWTVTSLGFYLNAMPECPQSLFL